MYFNEL